MAGADDGGVHAQPRTLAGRASLTQRPALLLREALAFASETDLRVALMTSPNQLAAVPAGMTHLPRVFTDPYVATQPV